MSTRQDTQPDTLDRATVFAQLEQMGADRAVVEFSGGNDEGGPDAITLFVGTHELRTLHSGWSAGDEDSHLLALADALCAAVFEAYGTFAGDFDVTGEVIWRVSEKTVQMIRDERTDYEHFEELI